MTVKTDELKIAERRLRWPLRLTRWGMFAERLTRAYWPLWTVAFIALGALLLGLPEFMAIEAIWAGIVLTVVGLGYGLVRGALRFRWPTKGEALDRLDRTLPGRPITALGDTQAIGATDEASRRVWKAHVERMARKIEGARAVEPDLRISKADPYALRYVAVLFLAVGLLFGSFLRVTSVEAALQGGGADLATGPVWEGWAEPPAYTGRPSLYLNDLDDGDLRVPQGTLITIRLYGEVGALTVAETVSGRTEDIGSAAEPSQTFTVTQSGRIEIHGEGGQKWAVTMEPDRAPDVRLSAKTERGPDGAMRQAFLAQDDYGVVAGTAELTLDLDRVDRRYGRAIAPEPRAPILLDLPMPLTGDRRQFEEVLIEDLSKHPWAGRTALLTLQVEDALGQTGLSEGLEITIPARRFFDPMANAIAEQRSDILWSRQNGPRAAGLLRAISYAPEGFIENHTAYLKLRILINRLETRIRYEQFDESVRDEIAEALWDLAIDFEEGRLSDALERLRKAQEKLAEAMRNGATDEEIADLMQELRDAMQDYMRQLAEEQQRNGENQQQAQNQQNMQEITGDQLEEMLQRLQELMEQGRMEEAQELLRQLQQMMENMQVTQGQQGQGQQSPGEQAMEGLQETLRQQQGLSDEAFRDLQEQFNPGAQAGQSGENSGESGGQGQGAEHDQQGQGQGRAEGGQGGQPGDQQNQGQGQQGLEDSLADRQRELRRELNRQSRNLPGAGTPEGDAARDALDRAGRAMDGAEEALRQDNLPEALDQQADAMEALREGMRNLGEAMAQNQQQQQQGQQGSTAGRDNPESRDPLGREAGAQGRIGTDENLLQGEDVYRRAEELLDEIRRRSGEQARPEAERDYLKRLLDRF